MKPKSTKLANASTGKAQSVQPGSKQMTISFEKCPSEDFPDANKITQKGDVILTDKANAIDKTRDQSQFAEITHFEAREIQEQTLNNSRNMDPLQDADVSQSLGNVLAEL